MKVKLAKWGNSVGLRLPKAIIEMAGLKPGAEVEVTAEGRDLRIRPHVPIPRYRLEDLVAEARRLGPENEPELVGWGPDVGDEIIDDEYSRGEIAPDGVLNGNNVSRSR